MMETYYILFLDESTFLCTDVENSLKYYSKQKQTK